MDDNRNEETPKKKGSLLLNMAWDKVPLRIKLYIIGGAFGILLFIFIFIVIVSQLESVNSTEVAGSKRYDGNNTYERDVIEFQKYNNITEYVDKQDEQVDAHEAYYNALYKAYKQYMAVSSEPSFFGSIWNSIKGLFSGRSSKAKLKSGGGYGVQVDTSLISTTLYSNRFYGDMLYEDEQVDDYYINGKNFYDLHTTSFRNSVESSYFAMARSGQDNTKYPIEAIEILSKYMIERVETYYTLQKQYEGIYYDTTRHIKIVNTYIDMGDCSDYVIDNSKIVFDHYRIGGGNYSWSSNAPLECKNSYAIENYDDGKYNVCEDDLCDSNNPTGNEYSAGFEYLSYNLDCEGFQKYLFTEYPLVNDEYGNNHREMFCDGDASCYNDFFIPAYYHEYVGDINTDVGKNKLTDIVYDIYSVLEYYESATQNFNVCRTGYNAGVVSGDASCGVTAASIGGKTKFDGPTVSGNTSLGSTVDGCLSDQTKVRVFVCKNASTKGYGESSFAGGSTTMNGYTVSKDTITLEEYVKTVTLGEMYASDPIESLKAQMLMIKSRILADAGKSSRVKVVGDELWLGMQSGCLHAYHNYKYENLNGTYKQKIDSAYNDISDKVIYYKDQDKVFPSPFGNKAQTQLRSLGKSNYNYLEIFNNFDYSKNGVSYSKAEVKQCVS